jgi:hypothetical protein
VSTHDTPNFAPTQVGPFQYAEPTAEHRAAFAAYLRALAEAVENPDRPGLPIRIGQVVTDMNERGLWDLTRNMVEPFGNDKIGQQVKITVGWGTPKFGWDWS